MTPIVREYQVPGDDFGRAGEASGRIKAMLKELGFPPAMVRRAAVTTYEAEINMVIHAGGGHVRAVVSPESVTVVFTDHGPGIPDVALAMQAGWSTAPENIRQLGFGAGMGLPNILKYSDELDIQTEVGRGTTLTITIRPERRGAVS